MKKDPELQQAYALLMMVVVIIGSAILWDWYRGGPEPIGIPKLTTAPLLHHDDIVFVVNEKDLRKANGAKIRNGETCTINYLGSFSRRIDWNYETTVVVEYTPPPNDREPGRTDQCPQHTLFQVSDRDFQKMQAHRRSLEIAKMLLSSFNAQKYPPSRLNDKTTDNLNFQTVYVINPGGVTRGKRHLYPGDPCALPMPGYNGAKPSYWQLATDKASGARLLEIRGTIPDNAGYCPAFTDFIDPYSMAMR